MISSTPSLMHCAFRNINILMFRKCRQEVDRLCLQDACMVAVGLGADVRVADRQESRSETAGCRKVSLSLCETLSSSFLTSGKDVKITCGLGH